MQATDRYKIFAKTYLIKSVTKLCKELLSPNIKKTNKKILTGISTEKIHKWEVIMWKDVHHMSSGKYNLKQ